MEVYYPEGNDFRFPVPHEEAKENKRGEFEIPVEEENKDKICYDISKVPVWQGSAPRSDTIDNIQVEEYQFREELRNPNVRQEKLHISAIVHVRSHADAKTQVAALVAKADQSTVTVPLIVGFDVEGKCATVQMAARHENMLQSVLFQMKSNQKPTKEIPITHLRQEGTPTMMAQILTHRNVIFSGCQVR